MKTPVKVQATMPATPAMGAPAAIGRRPFLMAALAGTGLAMFGSLRVPVASAASLPLGPQHAIAIHSTPKYGPDFSHFDYVDPAAPKGGEIRLASYGGFDTLNPFVLRGQPPQGISLVFDTLMVSSDDEVFTEYGLLAETIEVGPGNSWVEFVLRPEARFHDGSPVTVEDVIWTFNALREKGNPIYRSYWANVDKVEKTGDRAVRFVFSGTPNAELPAILGQLPVLSARAFEGRDFASTTLEPLMSSGPYRVGDFQPGRSMTYQRVEDWWGRDLPVSRGQNNFDRIRYEYFRDLDVAFEAFKAGAYDFRLENSAKNWATGYDVRAVKDGRITREELPHEDPQGMQAFVFNTRRPIFADRRVRHALNLLFDFAWTRTNLFYGQYDRSESFFSNTELAASDVPSAAELAILEPYRGRVPDEVFTTPFKAPTTDGSGNIRSNMREAIALLTAAGWVLKGGKLLNAAGQQMAFEFLLTPSSMERVTLPYIRNLERVGIAAEIRVVDTAQYGNRTRDFDFDIIVDSFQQSLSPGNEQRDFWGSVEADKPGSRNTPGIKDRVIDELIEKLIEAPDRESLIAHTRALDRVLSWGWYVIPQWHSTTNRVAYWNRFAHHGKLPKYRLPVVTTWWFDAAKESSLQSKGGTKADP